MLSPRGTLWTWTVQNFVPPRPPYKGPVEDFAPYGVGYVELPEGIRIETRLTESEPEKLRIGMEMQLVIETFSTDEWGRQLMCFAFRPIYSETERLP